MSSILRRYTTLPVLIDMLVSEQITMEATIPGDLEVHATVAQGAVVTEST